MTILVQMGPMAESDDFGSSRKVRDEVIIVKGRSEIARSSINVEHQPRLDIV